VPGAVSYKKFTVAEDSIRLAEGGSGGITIFAGYDKSGELKGFAARAGAQGYADMIHLLYGYDPACKCIRGIKVLKLAETPGLGDKIITDKAFVKNFDALDASLNAEGTALENDIVTVKHGSKKHEWEIDAISGATISARAVGKALNQSAQQLLPVLHKNLDRLRAAGREQQN
jgi:electron transport complex protein RnfG